jgi:hypothetical protein
MAELAAKVMQTIGIRSHVDADQASLLTAMIRAEPVAGATMFQAMGYVRDRSAVLQATANEALRSWEHILFAAVMEVERPWREEHDRFIRHLWGSAENLPNALLLMPPAVAAYLDLHQLNAARAGKALNPAPHREAYSQILVYEMHDLDQALVHAQSIARYVQQLRSMIVERADTARQWLIRQPEIQNALPRLIKSVGLDVQDMLVPHHG